MDFWLRIGISLTTGLGVLSIKNYFFFIHTYSLLNLIFLLTTSDILLFFLFTSSLILNYSSVYIYFISFFCLSFMKLHLLSYFDYFSSHFQPFRMSHHPFTYLASLWHFHMTEQSLTKCRLLLCRQKLEAKWIMSGD